jgi:hypothetical protein
MYTYVNTWFRLLCSAANSVRNSGTQHIPINVMAILARSYINGDLWDITPLQVKRRFGETWRLHFKVQEQANKKPASSRAVITLNRTYINGSDNRKSAYLHGAPNGGWVGDGLKTNTEWQSPPPRCLTAQNYPAHK